MKMTIRSFLWFVSCCSHPVVHRYAVVMISLSLLSCEKETEWPLDGGQLPLMVVDGMLTNEMKAHEIVLSLPITNPGTQPIMVSGATVVLSGGDSSYVFTEDPMQPGHYYSKPWVNGIAGQTYTLTIIYGNDTISGSDRLHPAQIFDPLTITLFNENDSLYKVSYVCPAYSPNDFAMYEVLLDWRHVDGFDPVNSIATMYFYTLGSLDMGEIAGNDFESVIFPKGTQIRERRYSISEQYAAWLREVLIETQWNNGIVVVQSGNATGNFGNSVAGYFSACGVAEWNGIAQ